MSDARARFAAADAIVASRFDPEMSDADLLELVRDETAVLYPTTDLTYIAWRIGTVETLAEPLAKLRAAWTELKEQS